MLFKLNATNVDFTLFHDFIFYFYTNILQGTKHYFASFSLVVFHQKHFSFYFIFIFISPLKCDTKISIDIYIWEEGKWVGEPWSMVKKNSLHHTFCRLFWFNDKASTIEGNSSSFLKNWVWHRKITPLKPFYPFAFLPAIQTHKSGFRKAFWRHI